MGERPPLDSPVPSRPTVSVVITAYNRRTYLLTALQSIVQQRGMRQPFEVVIIKNFADPEIDAFIQSHGFVLKNLPDGSVGNYLATAIQVAKGDVIAFLDDDDTFYPGKLARVERAFAEDPQLVYFHNGHDIRYDDSRRARSLLHQPVSFNMTLDSATAQRGEIDRLIAWNLLVNLSCVSMIRSALLAHIDAVRTLNGATDYMAIYLAFAHGGHLVFDKEVLTTYRIHESSMRPSGSVEDSARSVSVLAQFQVECHSFGTRLRGNAAIAEVASGMRSQWVWLRCLMGKPTRREVLRAHAEYFRSSLLIRPRYALLSLAFGVGSLLSPSLGRKMFLASRSVASH